VHLSVHILGWNIYSLLCHVFNRHSHPIHMCDINVGEVYVGFDGREGVCGSR
jgi:hypothetical protein